MDELELFVESNEFDEDVLNDSRLYDQHQLRVKVLNYSLNHSPSKWQKIRAEWDRIEDITNSEPLVPPLIVKLVSYCLSAIQDHPPVTKLSDTEIDQFFQTLDHRLMVCLRYKSKEEIPEFILKFFRRLLEILLIIHANLEQHLLCFQLFGKFQAQYGPQSYDGVTDWLQSIFPSYQPQIPIPPVAQTLRTAKVRRYSTVPPPLSYSPSKDPVPQCEIEIDRPLKTKQLSASSQHKIDNFKSSELLQTPLSFISARTHESVVYPSLTGGKYQSSPVIIRKPVVSTPPNLNRSSIPLSSRLSVAPSLPPLSPQPSTSCVAAANPIPIHWPSWTRTKRALDIESQIWWEDRPRAPKARKTLEARNRQSTVVRQKADVRNSNRVGRLFYGDSNFKSPMLLSMGDTIYVGGAEFHHLSHHLADQRQHLQKAEQIIVTCGINDIVNRPLNVVKRHAYQFFSDLIREQPTAIIVYLQVHIHKLPRDKKSDAIELHNYLRDYFSPRVALLRPPTYDDSPLHHLNRAEDDDYRKFLRKHLPVLVNSTSPRVVQPPETYSVHLQKS